MSNNIGPINLVVGVINTQAIEGLKQVEKQHDATVSKLNTRPAASSFGNTSYDTSSLAAQDYIARAARERADREAAERQAAANRMGGSFGTDSAALADYAAKQAAARDKTARVWGYHQQDVDRENKLRAQENFRANQQNQAADEDFMRNLDDAVVESKNVRRNPSMKTVEAEERIKKEEEGAEKLARIWEHHESDMRKMARQTAYEKQQAETSAAEKTARIWGHHYDDVAKERRAKDQENYVAGKKNQQHDDEFMRNLDEATRDSKRPRSLKQEASRSRDMERDDVIRLAAALDKAQQSGEKLDKEIRDVGRHLRELKVTDKEVENVLGEGQQLGGAVGKAGGLGKGSRLRSFRNITQNLAYGFEDALISYQMGGISGGARGATNNLTAIAAAAIPGPVTAGLSIAGIAIAGAAISHFGKQLEDSFKKGREDADKLWESLDRLFGRIEAGQKLKMDLGNSDDIKGNAQALRELALEREQAQTRMKAAQQPANNAREELKNIDTDEWAHWYAPWQWNWNSNDWWTRDERKIRAQKQLDGRQDVIRKADEDIDRIDRETKIRQESEASINRRHLLKNEGEQDRQALSAQQRLKDEAYESGGRDMRRDRLQNQLRKEFKDLVDNTAGMSQADWRNARGVFNSRKKLMEFDLAQQEKKENQIIDKPFNAAMDIGSREDAQLRQKLMFGIDDQKEAIEQRKMIVEEIRNAIAVMEGILRKPPAVNPPVAPVK